MSRVLVVRLGSLGDLVHTLPAVAAIARAQPGMAIDWLVDEVHRPFVELVPVVSDVVALEGRTTRAWLDVRVRLRERRYDVALDFQGLLKSAALARLSGAARVIGFDRQALREAAAAPFYTEQAAVGESGHVIEKNLRLAAVLGASPAPMSFPIRDVASPVLDNLPPEIRSRFVLLNGGAAWPNKRWPPERLGRIAAWLRDTHGLASLVLWGPGEEALAAAIAAASHGAAMTAPETNLADLVALGRRAHLMVSGDTGPTHVAAAVGAPVVALFGPTNPRRNGPWDDDDVTISRYEACDCHYARACRRDDAHWCLSTIAEADVRAAIDTRLARAAARRAQAASSREC